MTIKDYASYAYYSRSILTISELEWPKSKQKQKQSETGLKKTVLLPNIIAIMSLHFSHSTSGPVKQINIISLPKAHLIIQLVGQVLYLTLVLTLLLLEDEAMIRFRFFVSLVEYIHRIFNRMILGLCN
jgi:hypothetical protein